MSRDPQELSPQEFETMVKAWFEATGRQLDSFEARHRERLSGLDGDYTIDVTVRFTAFEGARFLVLAECKRHTHPIKRSVVELLHNRVQSTGAHKGMVFATTSFQSGAKEYAEQHRIALIELFPGEFAFIQMSAGKRLLRLPDDYPEFVGICRDSGVGPLALAINEQHTYCLSQILDDLVDDARNA